MNNKTYKLILILALSFLLQSARAVTITYTASDLSDNVTGQDLWRYEYSISDFVFNANQGFTIYFKVNDYAQLQTPPPFVNSDWDTIAVQPDPAIPDSGYYDGLSSANRINGASLSDPFIIDFVWQGIGTPGVQPFELYDLSSGFTILETGTTVPASSVIPEDSPTFIFFVCALITVMLINSIPVLRPRMHN